MLHKLLNYYPKTMNLPVVEHIHDISLVHWRRAQVIACILGLFILLSLFIIPSLGLLIVWNIIIPIAPLVFLLYPGLWRNICPMGIATLLPRHFGLSQNKRVGQFGTALLNFIGIILLFSIVPLRHALFNIDGRATGVFIIGLTLIGVVLGAIYDWKSAWCSGLCPVHPVEQLYGFRPLHTFKNAHCSLCTHCTIPCPDSTPQFQPGISHKYTLFAFNQLLIVGGLPGFIWAWFQIPDGIHIHSYTSIYILPSIGFIISISAFLILYSLFPHYKHSINKIFSLSSIVCYYWFRIPALFGFGIFPTDGLLFDLHNYMPYSIIHIMRISLFTLILQRMLIVDSKSSWLQRPAKKKDP